MWGHGLVENVKFVTTKSTKNTNGNFLCGSPGRFALPPSDAPCEAGRENRPGEPQGNGHFPWKLDIPCWILDIHSLAKKG
jgi:hypothetical protein